MTPLHGPFATRVAIGTDAGGRIGFTPPTKEEGPAMTPSSKIKLVVVTIGAARGRAARGRPLQG